MPNSVIPETLVAAYQSTEYRVRGDAAAFALRIGHKSTELADLYERTGLNSAVFITAENPFSQTVSAVENAATHERLRHDLAATCPWFAEGDGHGQDPDWPAEKSFLALGISRHRACALGIQYSQNAVVWASEDAIPELVLLR